MALHKTLRRLPIKVYLLPTLTRGEFLTVTRLRVERDERVSPCLSDNASPYL